MNRRFLARLALGLAAVSALALPLAVQAADEAPDALIKRLSADTLDTIKSDPALRSGDVSKVMALVDTKIIPNVDFRRMTAAAVGPQWRQATPDQQTQLQNEFKTLLVRTYAGALSQVSSDQSITVKPLRAEADDKEVVVRTEVTGHGDPIQLDYRLEKTPGEGAGWKIYNLNVMGVWLVETYRSQFSQEINAHGVDGLIKMLGDLNQANAKKG